MSRLSRVVASARGGAGRRGPRRLLAALAVAVGVLVVGAGPASAHAVLVTPQPGFASVVSEAPKALRLGFSEHVDPTADSFTVTGPSGRALRLGAVTRDPTDPDTLVVPLPGGLGPGTYSVQWHVIGRDGHPTFGEYKFAVRAPSSSLASSGQSGAGPTVLGGAGRALSAGGGLALVGLAAFPLLVLRPARRRLDATTGDGVGTAVEADANRRLRLPAYAAAAVAAVGTLLVLADTVTGGRSSWGTLAHPGRVLDQATATGTGTLLLVRLAAIGAAVVLLALLQRGKARALPALALGAAASVLVMVVTFSLSSHAQAEADRVVAIPLDVMHLLAAGIWAGGLLGLALAGLPAARALSRRSEDASADAAGALANRFSTLAQGAMLALLATGAYASLMRITSFGDLGSVWGRDLVVKLALWVTLLVVASGSALRVVPVLADRAEARVSRRAAAGQLASSVRLELALAAALVVTAGILSATAPPDQTRPLTAATATAPTVTRASGTGSGYDVDVQSVTTGRGASAATVFGVSLTTEGTAASAPGASGVLIGEDGVAHGFELTLVDQGQWTSRQLAVRPGRYQMTVQVDRTNGAARIPVAVRVGEGRRNG